MARPPEPRLKTQLLGWLIGPLVLLLVLDTAVSYWAALNFSNRAHDRSLLEIAREVALHVKAAEGGALRFEISPAAQQMLTVDEDDRLAYRVLAPDGRSLAGDAQLAAPAAPLAPDAAPLFYAGQHQGAPVRMAAAWVPVEARERTAPVLVLVAETMNRRNRFALEILASVVVPQLLLILLATAAVVWGVTRGLAPLGKLRQAVSGRSHLDLTPLETHDVPREVKPLVAEVNALMERLRKTLDFQTRFMADAAHQLKTPVAGLKAQIELALRESEPQRLRHSLAQLYVGTDRMAHLVQQLLSLARNEPGAFGAVQLKPIDLDAFTLEVSMEWVPLAIKQDVDLGFESAGAPVMIDAEADRLRELINNLIDNAVRYSRRGGRVTVAVSAADGGGGRLSISDDGPAIPVEERERVFERFHRLLGTHTDGSGLGLAIVSEIAKLHGASITLEEDRDGVGNTFSVSFPAGKTVSL